jgi:hypothetical protein
VGHNPVAGVSGGCQTECGSRSLPLGGARPEPYFEVTYTDGSVEEIEADECQDNGARYLTFVNYRVLFVSTVYTEIVRRLDRPAVARIDKARPIEAGPGQ